jgi:hypothetical protein
MHHRKSVHYQEVLQCTKSLNGTCWFGAKTWWFHHEKIEKIKEDEKSENIKTISIRKTLLNKYLI